MVEVLKIICFSASFTASIYGIFLLVVMATYLLKKPDGQKTVFDLIVSDTFIPAGLFSIAATIVMLLGVLGSMSFWVAIIFALPTFMLHNLLLASVTVTFLTKFMFITLGDIMFGFSDMTIRTASLVTKMVLFTIFLILDRGGQKNPPVFDILATGFDR